MTMLCTWFDYIIYTNISDESNRILYNKNIYFAANTLNLTIRARQVASKRLSGHQSTELVPMKITINVIVPYLRRIHIVLVSDEKYLCTVFK